MADRLAVERVDFVSVPVTDLERSTVAGATVDTSVCHMAHFSDPDGNVFMLHRRYAPHES